MPFGRSHGKTRGLLLLALLAYSLVVAVTPFFHHDLECHARTPGHCVACIATPAALGAPDQAPALAPALTDIGGVEQHAATSPEASILAGNHGRSPPSQAL
jgi:hypothetical protein